MPTEAEVDALMAQLSAPPATPTATPTTPPAAADPSAPSPINVRTIDATGPLGLSPFTDAQTAASISALRELGLNAQDAAYLSSGKDLVVSASVRERAVIERAKCMADKDWVARYLAGGMVERELMSACVVRISAEVRE
jgi:hypothetical protein